MGVDMPMKNSITVNKPAADAWQLIGPDFASVADWMAAIPRAEPIAGTPLPGAPIKGRNSYLIAKFKGMYQEETITAYDDAAMSVSVDVALRNKVKGIPVKGYDATVTVEPINDAACKVTWVSTASVGGIGYVLYPLLRKSLNAGFIRNLEEIKHFVETGQPHPRKLDKIRSEAEVLAVA